MSTPRRVCRHGRQRLGPLGRATACWTGLRRARARDERGQALVEFALVLPLLVTILFAIIKFGIAINNYVVLTNAVRTGARTLAIGRGSTDPCASAITRVKNSASDLDPSKLVVTTSYGPNCPSISAPLVAGNDATLRASYPCDLVILGVDFAFGSCTISSKTTERIE